MPRLPSHRAFLASSFLVASCSGSGSGEGTLDITAVCLPATVPSGRSFTFRVTGGCGGDTDDLRCTVLKGQGSVEVTLVGPRDAPAGCVAHDKPCQVPALADGTWAFSFVNGAQHDRAVTAAAGTADPSCGGNTLDGGVPDGGT